MSAAADPAVPPSVAHGLWSAADYARWIDLVQSGQEAEGVAFIRDQCRDNLLLFDHLFVPRQRQVLPHIIDVYREVGVKKSAIIILPRGFSKSETLVIANIIHRICYASTDGPDGRFYDPRILLGQETAPAARAAMNSIRLIIETGGQYGLIASAFRVHRKDSDGSTHNLAIHEAASTWDQHQIVIPDAGSVGKNATLIAVGVGSSTQGLHPKLSIYDDVVTPNNSRTANGREVLWEWYKKTLFGTRDPGSVHWSIGTPLYEEDLNHRLVKVSGYYQVKSKPALNRDPTLEDFEPIFNADAERIGVRITEKGMELVSLWPCPLGTGNCPGTDEHYMEYGFHRSVEWLIHEKFLREPVAFTSDYMLRLLTDDERRFRPEMMRFFSRNPEMVGKKAVKWNEHTTIVPFPANEHIVDVVHAWDHAMGLRRVHDRTALARLYRDKDKRVYSMNVRGRWPVDKVLRTIIMQFQKESEFSGRRPRKLVMEGIGFQKERADFLQGMCSEILPMEIITSPVDKDTALAASGLLEAMVNGQFFLEYEDDDAVNEFLMFTPTGKFHDDSVDANRLGFVFIRAGFKKPVRVHQARGGRRRFTGY